MDTYDALEKRIIMIENRNKKVEVDKAWESSYTRRALLVVFTYTTMATYMGLVLKVEPWINAIVPTLGFLLSTLSLSFFKGIWIRHIHNKSDQ